MNDYLNVESGFSSGYNFDKDENISLSAYYSPIKKGIYKT